MASDWRLMSLGGAKVVLLDCVHKTPPKADTGLPYLAIPQMKTGTIDLKDARLIEPQHFDEWTVKADPQPHDVVLSRRCNPGVTAAVRPGLRFALGQNLVLLRANGKAVHPPFLKWLVQGPLWWEQIGKYINAGAVFDSLRCADVPKFELPIPPLPEQRRITAVLGALDDKIELNRNMNRTLEEMAQAIFKSWFIDFDGHTDFEDSDLGPIPREWQVSALDEVADFLNGVACQKYPAGGRESLPVIKIRELRQGVTDSSNRANFSIPGKYIVRDGDVLFSWSGSLLVKVWTGGDGALNQHVFKVTSDEYPRWFYYFWLHHHLATFQHIAAGKATTMGHINRRHLTEALVAVPPQPVVGEYTETLSPLLDRMVTNDLEGRTLAELRDTLLPKLISGEIRVPEAEEAIEEAV